MATRKVIVESCLIEIKDIRANWFEIIERKMGFVNRLTVDRANLREICKYLKIASTSKGRIVRKWGIEDQLYSYSIFQNFNVYGRYIRIVSQKGKKKSTIIIPKIEVDARWVDIAEKMIKLLDKVVCHNIKSSRGRCTKMGVMQRLLKSKVGIRLKLKL